MKRPVVLIIIVTLISTSSISLTYGRGNSGPSMAAPKSISDVWGKDKCSGTSTKITHGIIDPEKVSYFVPMGAMLSSHITPIDHIYAYFPGDAGQPISKPNGSYLVTSPAAGQIISVEDFAKTNQYPYPDYRVVISHSCNLYSVFIHVGKLTGAAASIVSKIGSRGDWSGKVSVKGGAVFADDSKNPNFDYSIFDGTKKLKGFVNLKSYAQAEQWKPWTADILNYLPQSIKSTYEEKFLSTTAPIGGKIDWDISKSAQGNWFLENTNGYRGVAKLGASYNNHGKVARGTWDTHLAIAPDAIDRNTTIFSIGDWEGCPCQFVSKDPTITGLTITSSSGVTVIELTEFEFYLPTGERVDRGRPIKGYKVVSSGPVVGLLALQVNADGTMKVEKLPGKTSSSEFTNFSSSAKVYTR